MGRHCQFSNKCKSVSCPMGQTCINSLRDEKGYFCYDYTLTDMSKLLHATVVCAIRPRNECKLDQNYLDILDEVVRYIRTGYNLVRI